MIRYQERYEDYESYDLMYSLAYCSREDQVKIINNEIINVKYQIRCIKLEISRLGIILFGQKRQRKRQLKAELKKLQERLSTLQLLRNWNNRTI